jgi:hypothetical protein
MDESEVSGIFVEEQPFVGVPKKPIYKRQQFLLAFIQQLNDDVSVTDLQKLVFLYLRQKHNDDYYDFVPYRFGSYSFQLAQDINVLRSQGHLSADTQRIVPIRRVKSLEIDANFVESLRGKPLIKKVYQEYPYYAINSEIAKNILDTQALQRIDEERGNLKKNEQMLFSIGYEGKNLEKFFNMLLKKDVKLLCDVRKNPISHKFGFSKGMLQIVTERIGIAYIHFPELGIETQKRQCLQGLRDYEVLFSEYENELIGKKVALTALYDLLIKNKRIALMCFERDPNYCHRTRIKNYMTKNFKVESEDL